MLDFPAIQSILSQTCQEATMSLDADGTSLNSMEKDDSRLLVDHPDEENQLTGTMLENTHIPNENMNAEAASTSQESPVAEKKHGRRTFSSDTVDLLKSSFDSYIKKQHVTTEDVQYVITSSDKLMACLKEDCSYLPHKEMVKKVYDRIRQFYRKN